MKIEGPYAHNGGFRCRVLTATGRRWCPTARSERAALAVAEQTVSLAMQQGRISVEDAIEEYQAHQRDKGNREKSIVNTGQVLRRFFAPVIRDELARLTSHRAANLYEQLRRQKSPRTNKPLSVDSHRNYLLQARSLLGWCVERGWLRANPLADVKGIGRRQHGKQQLRIDESRRLVALCLREADTDDGAVAVLVAIFMGLRASEIISRTVRDLDAGGSVLWIDDNRALGFRPKTDAGRRPVSVPEELQPFLLARAQRKPADALIFATDEGGAHWRDWPREQTQRLCRRAGVPEICAHALRGVASTAAAQAGATPQLVAKMLGHESPSMTLRSYIAPNTVDQAERQQALRTLAASPQAGRTIPKSEPSGSPLPA